MLGKGFCRGTPRAHYRLVSRPRIRMCIGFHRYLCKKSDAACRRDGRDSRDATDSPARRTATDWRRALEKRARAPWTHAAQDAIYRRTAPILLEPTTCLTSSHNCIRIFDKRDSRGEAQRIIRRMSRLAYTKNISAWNACSFLKRRWE